MAQVSIVHSTSGGPAVMAVQCDGESAVTSLISTPPEASYEWGAQRIVTTDRPGFKPASTPAGPGLKKITFDHVIWAENPQHSIEHLLSPLEAVVKKGKKVKFFNAGALATDTWYWIESVEVAEELKGDGNRASRAKLTWSLVEATTINKVDWSKTKPQEQPPVKIEAKGPEEAATDTSKKDDDKDSDSRGSSSGGSGATPSVTPGSNGSPTVGKDTAGGALSMF